MTDRARAIERHATRAARRHHQPDRIRAELAGEQRVLEAGDAADLDAGATHRWNSREHFIRKGRKERERSTPWFLFAYFAFFADKCSFFYRVTSGGSPHCAGYRGPMNVRPCAGA